MGDSIEFRELEAFFALAEELHFGRAGERLGLTSSRVSQILRALERKLGAQLLFRSSRRVELTALGEQLHGEGRLAVEQVRDVVDRIKRQVQVQRSTLRLGLFSDPVVSRVPQIVRAFERAHPECLVEATEVPVADVFGPLRRGEMDLVASWLPTGERGFVTGPVLSSDPRVLAVAADHPLAQRDAVSIEDLADYEVPLFASIPRAFRDVWIPPRLPSGRSITQRPFNEQSQGDPGRMTSELLYLVATGRIVHPTVPTFANMFGHPDIVHIPIIDLPRLRSALIWRRRALEPIGRDFVRIAREMVLVERNGNRRRGPRMSSRATHR